MNSIYCNNCGKTGHSFHQCKSPIMSFGVIAFRRRPTDGIIEYLMIRRKDTLGFIDFMRGKYSVHNKYYIMNMFKQMTVDEKEKIYTSTFDELWAGLWGSDATAEQYRLEETVSREKWDTLKAGIYHKDDHYSLESIVLESMKYERWTEAEWGIPKGRRDIHESDYDCAIREFCEETGYSADKLVVLKNMVPYEEIFTGSNYKSYKHKYYITYMRYADTLATHFHQQSEVSCSEWKSFDKCMDAIRSYNLEKKRLISNLHTTLTSVHLFAV